MSELINIAAHLPAMAERQPDVLAIACPDGTRLTYKQLNDDSDRIARGLERVGIRRGVRTVLMVKPSRRRPRNGQQRGGQSHVRTGVAVQPWKP